MLRMKLLAAIAMLMGSIALAHAAAPALQYKENIRGPAPIPPSEQALQTITAEPWFKVSDEGCSWKVRLSIPKVTYILSKSSVARCFG